VTPVWHPLSGARVSALPRQQPCLGAARACSAVQSSARSTSRDRQPGNSRRRSSSGSCSTLGVALCSPTLRTPFPISSLTPPRAGTNRRWPTLGSYIGFDADRPEQIHGVGPAVLWRTDAGYDFVIEAKSEKQEDNPLYKKDHAQLLEAEHWFHGAYPGRGSIRVSALPEPIADQKATPTGTFALRLTDATRLAGAVREMLTELVASPGVTSGVKLIKNHRFEIIEAAG
jgi:hypothetical protein